MGDLEDKILKKNIPGKYTWWEKDSDEEGKHARADWVDREASDPEKEMTEVEKQKKWIENDCPEPIRRTIMARQAKESARTGVKGVLADFHDWKLAADAEDILAKEYQAAMLKRMVEGHKSAEGPSSTARPRTMNPGESDDNVDDEDDTDEAFLGRYRRRRLQQLKGSAGRPQFGQIQEVERSAFVSAVDTEDPRTSVVVHLYEPYIGACRRMNRFLEVLASRQPSVKFLRLRSTAAAEGEFDLVALPTLLIYRNGEVVGCVTRVTDDVGDNFTMEDVEWLLQEHDVFEATQAQEASMAGASSAGGEKGPHNMATRRHRVTGCATDSDDDDGDLDER